MKISSFATKEIKKTTFCFSDFVEAVNALIYKASFSVDSKHERTKKEFEEKDNYIKNVFTAIENNKAELIGLDAKKKKLATKKSILLLINALLSQTTVIIGDRARQQLKELIVNMDKLDQETLDIRYKSLIDFAKKSGAKV